MRRWVHLQQTHPSPSSRTRSCHVSTCSLMLILCSGKQPLIDIDTRIMDKLNKGYSSCCWGESRLSPNGIQMNSGDGSFQGGPLAGGFKTWVWRVWWCATARHIDDVTVILFVWACHLKTRVLLVVSAHRQLITMETEPLAEVKVDPFTWSVSQPQHVAAYFVHLISFFFFGAASQFPSNPTDATTCFIFMQTTADLLKDCVFIISRPARFTWQCLLVSKNCSEVRVDGESRAGSAGRRRCGDRGGNGRAVT